MAAWVVSDEDIDVIELNYSEVIDELSRSVVRYLHVGNDSSLNCPGKGDCVWNNSCNVIKYILFLQKQHWN